MKSAPLLAVAAVAIGAASSAQADARRYCEAYAQDAATSRWSGRALLTGIKEQVTPEQWQSAYDLALADCLATFAPAPPKILRTAPKPAAPQKPDVVVAAQSLKPHSKAWNDYCAKKYNSFDPETGLYTAMSGKKRICLVTPS